MEIQKVIIWLRWKLNCIMKYRLIGLILVWMSEMNDSCFLQFIMKWLKKECKLFWRIKKSNCEEISLKHILLFKMINQSDSLRFLFFSLALHTKSILQWNSCPSIRCHVGIYNSIQRRNIEICYNNSVEFHLFSNLST